MKEMCTCTHVQYIHIIHKLFNPHDILLFRKYWSAEEIAFHPTDVSSTTFRDGRVVGEGGGV